MHREFYGLETTILLLPPPPRLPPFLFWAQSSGGFPVLDSARIPAAENEPLNLPFFFHFHSFFFFEILFFFGRF